ncbi:serine/threonine protein kinase [Candidatus Uabimicrobium amorphum]|uniref:Putative serine/threonine-protein kinase PknB n=1 Tax=Uabimicrobium amorphum TaxID=2596890 RepID=A0A5S9IJV0_UABAM|nr:serine/threonine-protein kinase [Candidatus Uabimicrobium amorphum]BBM82380.1 putative serine/threonine-protein kinase PknB [Candidatus Uabimicrobium amorphum]
MENKHTAKRNVQLSPGQQFLHYHIESIVGQGAMGVVYKAYDTKRKQHVALKILQARFIGEKQHRQFVREVKAIAKLDHKHIVKLFDVGTHPTYYFTMEYVAGKTLQDLIRDDNSAICISTVVKMIHKVAEALYHAHVKGIIHGDIKPQNIVVDERYQPKIMDFGLAKNRKNSGDCVDVLQGTPAYLAPEQLQYKTMDKRSDIYSLGVTMYYALTKKLPFSEKNHAALFYQIVNSRPQKLSEINAEVPTDLEEICLKCMERSAESRYVNAKFLADDLQEFIAGKSLLQMLSQKIYDKRVHIELLFVAILAVLTFVVYNSKQEFAKKNMTFLGDDRWDDRQGKYLETFFDKEGIGFFTMSARRYGMQSEEQWIKKTRPAVTKIYRKLQKQRQLNLPLHIMTLADKYLRTMVEIQRDGFILDEEFHFATVCDYGLQTAKKYRAGSYITKFEDFKRVYDLHVRLRDLETWYNEELATQRDNLNETKDLSAKLIHRERLKNLEVRHRQAKRNIISQVVDEVSGGHAFLELAFFGETINWQREKLLLHAIRLEDSYCFYEKLGEYYIKNYLLEEGIVLCKKALQRNPYSFVARFYLAHALIFRGEYKTAFRHLSFLEKTFFGTGKEVIYLEKTRLFVMLKDMTQAKKALQDAKTCHENASRKLGGFYKEWRLWQEVVEKNDLQKRDISKQELVKLYYLTGQVDKAYTLVNETKDTSLQLAIFYKLLCKKTHEFDRAHEIWLRGYTLATNIIKNARSFDHRAMAYRYALMLLSTRQGKKYNAYLDVDKSHMKFLIKTGRELGEYYFVPWYLAKFARHVGGYEEVIHLCREARNRAPWYKSEIDILEKSSLARWHIYLAPGKKKRNADIAIKLLRELINNHNYTSGHISLGYVYTHMSVDIKKAVYHFGQVDPQMLSVTHLLDFCHDYAHLHAKLQKYDKAIFYMENYLKLNPDFMYAKNALQRFRKKDNR